MKIIKFMQIGVIVLTVALLSNCSKGGDSPQPSVTQPRASISDVTKAEGNSGTTQFVFNVTLDKSPTQQVSINYSVTGLTAKVNEDYTHNVQSLSFAPNETQKQLL